MHIVDLLWQKIFQLMVECMINDVKMVDGNFI